MGVTTRKKKKKTKHGYSTRGVADEEDTATNRLTTKALYDTEDEEEVNGSWFQILKHAHLIYSFFFSRKN